MLIQYNNNTPNFGALHVANCGKIKIYKLTDSSDMKFIKLLRDNIDMSKLMPNLTRDEYLRWHEMLEYAVDNAQKSGNSTYIEAINNKPCGIITYTPGSVTKLDCICTWPIEFGQKVKLAGQTLFYQVFQDFQKIKGKRIKLDAITNGPFDTIKKYQNLGFVATSNVHPTKIEMETSASKVKEICKRLSQLLDYKEVKHEKVNLLKTFEV